MDIYNVMELSKIYKRILNVEIRLKERIKFALTATYSGKEFNRLFKYIRDDIPRSKYKYKRNGRNENKINDILNSNAIQEERLESLFNTIYLSDTLKILTDYDPICKDKNFKRNFYQNIPRHTLIEQNAANLRRLRNAVMHFNYDSYTKNKILYLEALGFWERLLYCPNAFMHTLQPETISTKNILRALANNCSDFFNLNDRIICDMFDDLAFINGQPVRKLPKLWTVGRQIYELKQELNS